MTKNEERRILTQIENLINATGADSYISMAFAGCVEMAKDNIDNDFGNCMKEQRDSARWELEETQKYLDNANEEIRSLKTKKKEYEQEIFDLKKAVKEEHSKQLPGDLYKQLWNMVNEQQKKAESNMVQLAEVLSYAKPDENIEVYLNQLKLERERRDQSTKTLAYLEKYEPEHI